MKSFYQLVSTDVFFWLWYSDASTWGSPKTQPKIKATAQVNNLETMEKYGKQGRRESPHKGVLLSWPTQEVAQMEGLSEKTNELQKQTLSALVRPQGRTWAVAAP